MSVQMIDRQPSGTDTKFAVETWPPAVGATVALSGTVAAVSAVSGSLGVQRPLAGQIVAGSLGMRPDTVIRMALYLTDGSLSATERLLGGNEVEQQFMALASRWRDETEMLSSPTQQASHPDYLRIIALGRLVLPFILRELRDRGGQWYYALEALTGVNPIPPGAEGYIPKMKTAWLEWGESQGLI